MGHPSPAVKVCTPALEKLPGLVSVHSTPPGTVPSCSFSVTVRSPPTVAVLAISSKSTPIEASS